MAATPLGYFQRTDKGRFLYGRCKNYRLAAGLTAIPNVEKTLGTTLPLAGATVLATANDIAAYTTLPVVPDPIATLPSVGGITSPNPGGGYAVTGLGFARISNPPTITPVNTWDFGDGTDASGAGSASSTPGSYAVAGTYDVNLQMYDCLTRVSPEYTGPVVAA
jgi:hypothetical protein